MFQDTEEDTSMSMENGELSRPASSVPLHASSPAISVYWPKVKPSAKYHWSLGRRSKLYSVHQILQVQGYQSVQNSTFFNNFEGE